MALKQLPIFIKIKLFLVCNFLLIKSHISKDEEKNFICTKFQALIQTLFHTRKIEYACDTYGSQFTSRIIMHLSSASPRGGPRADIGTLLIVYIKVLVFPHPCGICSCKVPSIWRTQLDLKMHFRTLFGFFKNSDFAF